MALPWALAVLSLLPLLSAQSPDCANLTVKPITNATLDLISGKWFYVATVFRNPEFNHLATMVPTAFFYFIPNKTEDKIYSKEYQTIQDRCVYNDTYMLIHRHNGTMYKEENGTEVFAQLLHTKTPGFLIFSFYIDDEQKLGLSIVSNTTQLNEEQTKELQKVIKCMDMEKSEIIHADEKKDKCGPLEKQHEEEKKKEQEGTKEDSAESETQGI